MDNRGQTANGGLPECKPKTESVWTPFSFWLPPTISNLCINQAKIPKQQK